MTDGTIPLEERLAEARENTQRWREKNYEVARASERLREAASREKRNAARRRQRAENPEQARKKGREAARSWRAANPGNDKAISLRSRMKHAEKRKEKRRQEYANHKEEMRAHYRRLYTENPEPRKTASRQRRAEDPAKLAASNKAWREANPGKIIVNILKRRFRLEQRTPQWANLNEINSVYRDCPADMVVDHVVPLVGLTTDGYRVSGLHVFWNLAYLTPLENSRKGNRMRPEDHEAAGAPVSLPGKEPAGEISDLTGRLL